MELTICDDRKIPKSKAADGREYRADQEGYLRVYGDPESKSEEEVSNNPPQPRMKPQHDTTWFIDVMNSWDSWEFIRQEGQVEYIFQ